MQLRFFYSSSLALAILMGICGSRVAAQPNFGQPGYGSGDPTQVGVRNDPPPDLVRGQPPSGQGNYPMMQGQYPPQAIPPQNYGYPVQQGNYMPGQQTQIQQNPVQRKTTNPQEAAKIYQWFLNYDEIRRRAQMNPIEKQQADGLLARGLGLFMPGNDKLAAKQLLSGLVMRYQKATQSLQSLPLLPETKQLQEAYYQYFDNAMRLFADYLRVQDNVFAVDNTGQSIAKQLIQRKMMLENHEQMCKELDRQTRLLYGIGPYQY